MIDIGKLGSRRARARWHIKEFISGRSAGARCQCEIAGYTDGCSRGL